MESAEVIVLYLFDDYELSEQDFSLSRRGERMSVEPKALRVLFLLVAAPGTLLEKKTILGTVWKDTFVEESTLTRAIAILRKQLGDDPKAPKYIETVPTLGYRFIAQVRTVDPSSPASNEVREHDEPEAIAAEELPKAGGGESTLAMSHSARYAPRRIWIYGLAVGLCVTAVVFFTRQARNEMPRLSTKSTLVLADFINTSGEAVFDDALRQGMIVQLEQSPVIRLASEAQIRKTLGLMGMKLDSPLPPELGREICQRIGGDAVLEGSVARLGNEYILGLRARRCSTGEELDAEQIQVKRKEDALQALGEMAAKFRARIGESRASIDQLDIPLPEATTSSLDALKDFSQATRLFNSRGSRAAIPLLMHATELDPQFAVAYVWLGRMYADLGEEVPAMQATQKAYELRNRASDRERFLIDVSYDLLVSGNLARGKETCEAWEQMYPRDVYAHSFLAGVIYPAYGQYEKALEESNQTIEIDPDFVIGYRNAALNLIATGKPDDAGRVLQQASARKLFLPSFVTDAYRMAFLEGDEDGMKRAVQAAPANPWLLGYEVATLSLTGRLSEARDLSGRATSLARQSSRHDTEAQLQIAEAIPEALYGRSQFAKGQLRSALRISTAKSVEYGAAFAFAMVGEASEVSKLVNDLTRRFPDDTLVRYDYVPTIEAALALSQNQPQKAIGLLQEVTPFELSQPLHSVYLRGQALLAMHRPQEAIVEFRKIIDHPGLVMNDPLLNLAELGLARSYAAAGEKQKAQLSYQAVLQRWRNADSDFSLCRQVKKESAGL